MRNKTIKLNVNCFVRKDFLAVRKHFFLYFLDWPKLPPLPTEPEEEEPGSEEAKESSVKREAKKLRNPSGPKAKDPYESDDTTAMLPIFVAVGAFIPLVFCLCKL
jgi:hypothetical protein